MKMNEKLLMWLWLNKVFGEANPRKWDATTRFDTIEECYYTLKDGDYYGLVEKEIENVKRFDLSSCERLVEYCDKNNIKIYCCESEGFPSRLREIYNPPAVIFAKHSSKSLDFLDDNVVVSIVGARQIDDYYSNVTTVISKELASSGVIVASGFAVEVDTCAHRGAIAARGKTVAVLGSGINYDYPGGTMGFKDEIAANGAVISEYPPLKPPKPGDFKARNRLLSGISMGVLVTQASSRSGSLNTVSNAVSQGRDIFCVPPADIFNDKYSGVIDLLRDGAIAVFSAKDVLFEYCENYSHRLDYARNLMDFSLRSEDSSVFSGTQKETKKPTKKTQKNKYDNLNNITEKPAEHDLSGLSENQVRIVKLLRENTLLTDEISRKTQIGVDVLFSELTELEIMGIIKALPGNRFSIN